jgi:AcrR family transcriptional regulator
MRVSTKQPSRKELGRRERKRIETREKLYQAAMQLFAKHGFFATTTEDITEAADVGQGTFFNYFPTKGHVLIVLSEKQLAKLEAARIEAETGKLKIRDVLRKLVHRIVQELAPSRALTRSLLTAFVAHDEIRELMAQTMGSGREHIAKICALGQQRGEIKRSHNINDLAFTFQRSVVGTLLLWAMQSKGDLHPWLDKALDDFWTVAGD